VTLTILIFSHTVAAASAVALTRLRLRGRTEALEARSAALDTHELFLESIAAREQRLAVPHAAPVADVRVGRHRAQPPARRQRADVPPPAASTPSLLPNCGLAEAVAILATRRAQRVQEHRAFEGFLAQVQRSWTVPVARMPQAI
jgi:hypothetical protein